LLSYCLDFVLPDQHQRNFLLHVREEYTSKKAALKDYVSACGGKLDPSPKKQCSWKKYTKGVANNVFMGKVVKGSPFVVIRERKSVTRTAREEEHPVALSSCGAGGDMFVGGWAREGGEGLGGATMRQAEGRVRETSDEAMRRAPPDPELSCAEFYMPDVLYAAFRQCGIRISITQSHEGLNQGFSMATEIVPVEAQVTTRVASQAPLQRVDPPSLCPLQRVYLFPHAILTHTHHPTPPPLHLPPHIPPTHPYHPPIPPRRWASSGAWTQFRQKWNCS
jgi:hypothetical protein